MATQLISPNPHIPCKPGWCLQYVRETFGLPARYGSATEAWNRSTSQHRDRNYPKGVWFPIWWGLDTNVHGHVALVAPDGSVFSTSSLANTPYHHPNIAHVEAYYARYGMTLQYRGWTEDVAGFPVITNEDEDDMPSAKEVADEIFSRKFKRSDGGEVDLGAIVSWYNQNNAAIITGTANEVLNRALPWAGFDGSGRAGDRTTTTLAMQTGWLDAQHNGLAREIIALRELVNQLAVQQGVVIDYDKIAEKVAKAVNDDAAKRLSE